MITVRLAFSLSICFSPFLTAQAGSSLPMRRCSFRASSLAGSRKARFGLGSAGAGGRSRLSAIYTIRRADPAVSVLVIACAILLFHAAIFAIAGARGALPSVGFFDCSAI